MFVVRWNNGFWKLFNTRNYRDDGLFDLKKEAEEACAKANSR